MRRWLVLVLFLHAVTACNGSGSDPGSETDQALRRLIRANGLTGDPAAGLELPSIDDPVAVLGRKLFFSKSLGGDRDSACVSCHHPTLGGGDALALSIGVGADEPDLLGPGRAHPDGELTVPRNAPTTFNLALWETGLFWDSRVELVDGSDIRTPDSDYGTADPEAGDTLSAAQARFPVTSADEMRGFEFALGGTDAEVRTALEGRQLVSAPQIGRGKGDGFKGTNDFGRARETGDRNDRFSIRTPTLSNVSVTGPYLHSGAYDNLADVVRHHLDPQAAIERFDPGSVPLAASDDFARNTQEMLDFLEVSGRAIEFFDAPLTHTHGQVDDLVAFLETLTDPCVLDWACLAPWVADPSTDDVDGHLLIAVDQEGSPL